MKINIIKLITTSVNLIKLNNLKDNIIIMIKTKLAKI